MGIWWTMTNRKRTQTTTDYDNVANCGYMSHTNAVKHKTQPLNKSSACNNGNNNNNESNVNKKKKDSNKKENLKQYFTPDISVKYHWQPNDADCRRKISSLSYLPSVLLFINRGHFMGLYPGTKLKSCLRWSFGSLSSCWWGSEYPQSIPYKNGFLTLKLHLMVSLHF